MTLYQAAKMASDINNLHWMGTTSLRKIEALNMVLLYCDQNGVPLTTDQKLKLVGSKIEQAADYANIYIQNYIHKKLSI
jgi:hypothetical protein